MARRGVLLAIIVASMASAALAAGGFWLAAEYLALRYPGLTKGSMEDQEAPHWLVAKGLRLGALASAETLVLLGLAVALASLWRHHHGLSFTDVMRLMEVGWIVVLVGVTIATAVAVHSAPTSQLRGTATFFGLLVVAAGAVGLSKVRGTSGGSDGGGPPGA